MHQKSLLDAPDVQYAVGGSLKYWKRTHDSLLFVQKYYDKVSYEYVDDMMFLPDDMQLYRVWENRHILGDTYLWAKMTPQAAEQERTWVETTAERIINPPLWRMGRSRFLRDGYEENTDETHTPDLSCGYFLRTPDTTPIPYNQSENYLTGDYVRCMPDKPEGAPSFDESATNAYHFSGIRPAFYLNEDNAQILSGGGTNENPYVITGLWAPADGNDGAIEGVAVKPRPEISICINGKRGYYIDSARYDPIIDNGKIYVTRPWAEDMFRVSTQFEEPNRYCISQPGTYIPSFRFQVSPGDFTVKEIQVQNQPLEDATWDDAPMEKNGYFYLPLRSLAEFLGYTEEWSRDRQTVTYTKAD